MPGNEVSEGISSDLGVIWQEAIDNYNRITGNKNELTTRHIASTSEILTELDEMNKSFKIQRHDGSKRDRVRSLVRDSLTLIQALGEIAAHASKAVFPLSEAIFSAVRYLITTAKNVSGDYDKLEEFFEDVNSYLTGIEMWEHRIPSALGLKCAITTVFSSILLLCGTYTKYINKKRVVKAFGSLLSGEDTELKDAHRQFQKAVERVGHIVRNATLSTVAQTQVDTREIRGNSRKTLSSLDRLEQTMSSSAHGTKKINRYMDDQDRDSTLRCLSSLDFREHQREVFAKYHENTGQWLLNADSFQEWIYSTQPSTIWCPGDRMAANPHL